MFRSSVLSMVVASARRVAMAELLLVSIVGLMFLAAATQGMVVKVSPELIVSLSGAVTFLAVNTLVRHRRLRAEQLRLRDDARMWSRLTCDELTGLGNRGLLFADLRATIAAAGDDAQGLPALMLFGLDRLPAVRISFGDAAGDLLLCSVAERLSARLPEGWLLYRLEGGEFAILSGWEVQDTTVSRVAGDILDGLSRPFDLGIEQVPIGARIGITRLQPGDDAETSPLHRADLALQAARLSAGSQTVPITGEGQGEIAA